jgi:hypothetical protein
MEKTKCDFSNLAVSNIRLISDKHDGHIGIRVLLSIFQPASQVVEGFLSKEMKSVKADHHQSRDQP